MSLEATTCANPTPVIQYSRRMGEVNYVNSTSQDDLNKLQSETNEADIFSMILKANKELLEHTGNKKIEHGDIVLDNSRNAMICRRSPKSCLWPSSEDRNVYVPYRLSRDYDAMQLLDLRDNNRYYHSTSDLACTLV